MSTTLPLGTAFTGATVTQGQFKQAMTDVRAFLNDYDTYQWYAPGLAPTYVSTISFTLVGDQTAAFHVGRRFKAIVTAGTVYGRIATSVFTTLTTITVVLDSGTLDSGLSTIYIGVASVVNSGEPSGMFLIDRKIASASGTITFSNISQTLYDSYDVVADNIVPNAIASMLLRFGYGGIIDSGATSYEAHIWRFTLAASAAGGSASASAIDMCNNESVGVAANQYLSFDMKVFNNNNRTQATWKTTGLMSSGSYVTCVGGGKNLVSTSVLSDIQFSLSGGALFTTGTFSLYGLRK